VLLHWKLKVKLLSQNRKNKRIKRIKKLTNKMLFQKLPTATTKKKSKLTFQELLETSPLTVTPRTMSNSNETPSMETPIKMPIKKIMFSLLVAKFGFPVPSMVGAMEYTTTDQNITHTVLDLANQWGTKECPYITFAEPNYPERNRHFDINPLEKLVHNNYHHNGFEIRKLIAPQDFKVWKAFKPTQKEFPMLAPLAGRVIMVQGPSRNYWHSSIKLYYEKMACPVTKESHETTDTAIKADANRQTLFYLIVFKPGIVLDNYIFSSNKTDVQLHQNALKMLAGHEENTSKKEILRISLWWRIAKAGRTRIHNEATAVN
jgi:hypothetical protein